MGRMLLPLATAVVLLLVPSSPLASAVGPAGPAAMPLGTGPIAHPGGPYGAVEGALLDLDGSRSLGSSGGDLTFGPARIVNTVEGRLPDEEAAIASDGLGRVLVAWVRGDGPGRGLDRLLLSRRLPDGSFALPLELDTRERVAHGIVSPSISLDGDVALVAWGVTGYPPNGVYLRRSVDGGASFGPKTVVHSNGTYAPKELHGVKVMSAGDNVTYVLWHWRSDKTRVGGGDVYLARSENGTETFGAPVRVNDIPGIVLESIPASCDAAVDEGGNLDVVWTAMTTQQDLDVVFSRSDDGGLTFGPSVPVSDDASEQPTQPRIALGEREIHVVWGDFREHGASRQIWYASSADGGATFSADRRVSDEPAGTGAASRRPSLLSDGKGTLYLVWADARDGTARARVRVSRDDGMMFAPSVRIDPFNSEQHPDGAVLTGDGIAVVWTDTARPAAPRVPEKCSPFKCAPNVAFAEGSWRRPVASYAWDLDASADADWDGNATNDADASGPTPTVVYGDDGTYEVTLRVGDAAGATASATATVTVANLPPVIDSLTYRIDTVLADVSLRIAGERWHDARATVYEDGVPVGEASLTRVPGSPDAQEAFLGTIEPAAHAYDVRVAYTPEDDPVNGQEEGATPAWLVFRWSEGEHRLHHLFNVRHPDTWTWTATDVGAPLPAYRVAFDAAATDPGSDDLAFAWDFGDGGSVVNTYFNDGVAPDPPHSPGGTFPFSASDRASHAYLDGVFTATLTVTDDDGGVASHAVSLALPPWAAAAEPPRVRLHAPLLAGPSAVPVLPPPTIGLPATSPAQAVPASVWDPESRRAVRGLASPVELAESRWASR